MAGQDDDSVKFALLAHDLRTPLAAMRLTAELIGSGPLNDAQKDQLAILIRSIDTLTEITGDLIHEAQPGPGAETAPVRIGDVVADVAGLFRIAAEAKGLSFGIAIDDTAENIVTGHGGALRRVAAILLDNAVKYTSEGGIRVDVREIPSGDDDAPGDGRVWLRLSVTDTGPGIDPEEQARLFRPFVRGRHGRETGPGTGLGLWGLAQLVREMGGHLELTRAETGGSRFDVHVPVDPVEGGGEVLSTAADSGKPALPEGRLSGHVLIVDDNDTNCRLLEALLESFGISSEVAKSGEQAIGLARNGSYDAVLLDLHMPGMSGVETAEELGKLRSGNELPLIAVTAALESVGDDNLKRVGFQDILTKPLSPAGLYEVMAEALGARSASGSGER